MPRYLLRKRPPVGTSSLRRDVEYDSGDDPLKVGDVLKLEHEGKWKVVAFATTGPREPYESVALITRV